MTITWSLWKYTGSSWSTETAIPCVGINEITEDVVSTASFESLVDGSMVRLAPETRYTLGELKLTIPRSKATNAVIQQLLGYIKNNTGIKMTAPNGYTYEGYLTSGSKRWLLKQSETQKYIPDFTLKLFDVDSNGVIVSGTGFSL
jgi:hypothetical protein